MLWEQLRLPLKIDYHQGSKFDPKVGSRRTTKTSRPRHYSGRPHFVTLLYVCCISSNTAVFTGKRKITWEENFW